MPKARGGYFGKYVKISRVIIFRVTLDTMVLKRGVTRLAGHFAMDLAKFMQHVHPHVFVFNLLKIKFLKRNKTTNFKLVLYSFTFCFVSDERPRGRVLLSSHTCNLLNSCNSMDNCMNHFLVL